VTPHFPGHRAAGPLSSALPQRGNSDGSEVPWEQGSKDPHNPNEGYLGASPDATPLGLMESALQPQGSSSLATLGFTLRSFPVGEVGSFPGQQLERRPDRPFTLVPRWGRRIVLCWGSSIYPSTAPASQHEGWHVRLRACQEIRVARWRRSFGRGEVWRSLFGGIPKAGPCNGAARESSPVTGFLSLFQKMPSESTRGPRSRSSSG